MFVFLDTIHIKQGMNAVFEEAAAPFLAHTREEKGCQKAELFRNSYDDRTYLLVQYWESRADFDAHYDYAVSSDFAKIIGGCIDAPTSDELYEIAKLHKV